MTAERIGVTEEIIGITGEGICVTGTIIGVTASSEGLARVTVLTLAKPPLDVVQRRFSKGDDIHPR